MNWQEAAVAIVDKTVKQNFISEALRSELKQSFRFQNAVQAFEIVRKELAHIGCGWNKVWAGNALFGWWGETVTSEPIRLVAIEISRNEALLDEIRGFLQSRWDCLDGVRLSSEADRLCREMGIGTSFIRLTPAELRLLQRINLDYGKTIRIEKWRWSRQAGVAYLSDDGRETVRPELVAVRAIDAIREDDGTVSKDWQEALSRIDGKQEVFQIEGLSGHDRFIETMEFWGLGQRWAGGVKLYQPSQEWLKLLATSS